MWAGMLFVCAKISCSQHIHDWSNLILKHFNEQKMVGVKSVGNWYSENV